MSPEVAKQVVSLLIDALEQQAKQHLPPYLTDSFLGAASDLLEKGLYHVWQSLLENLDTVKLEAEVVEIIDHRGDGE